MSQEEIGLVLCGSGVYGSMLLGVLHQCEIHLKNIRMIAGTSSGAIIGTLLCVGYTPREITDIIKDNLPIISSESINMTQLFERYGLYSNRRFMKVILDMIIVKVGYNPTFADIYVLYQKDLIITGTNVTTQNAIYFDRVSCPTTNVTDALEISTCIPFVFPYILWNDQVCIDGALTDNLPMAYAHQYSPNLKLHALNIEYTYAIKPNSLVNFVLCLMKIIANKCQTQTTLENCKIHTLYMDTLCSMTTTNPDEIEALFQKGTLTSNLFKTQDI